jgi:hypothetical protein
MTTAIAYLAWAGSRQGLGDVTTFCTSYRANPAGRPHRLFIMSTGNWSAAQRNQLTQLAASVAAEIVELSDIGLDWGAYMQLAPKLDEEWLCWLNTYTQLQTADWLDALRSAADQESVGMAGATGSWGSRIPSIRDIPSNVADYYAARGALRAVAYAAYSYLVYLPRQSVQRLSTYPPFPNPHLRSNAFLMRRQLFLDFAAQAPFPANKPDTHALESGRRSLTRYIQSRGLTPVVVGRDRRSYAIEQWFDSGTFRTPGQPNLLIGDNQTRAYDTANSGYRRLLERSTWGRTATPAAGRK